MTSLSGYTLVGGLIYALIESMAYFKIYQNDIINTRQIKTVELHIHNEILIKS